MSVLERLTEDSIYVQCVLDDAKSRLLSRLNKLITVVDDCWIYNGSLNKDGYGLFYLSGKLRSAHRVYFEIFKDRLLDGYEIDHICSNRSCVNPDHLQQISRAEHLAISTERRSNRKICKRGHAMPENEFINSKGNIECKICSRLSKEKYQKRIRQCEHGEVDLYFYPNSNRKICKICVKEGRKRFAGSEL